MEAQQPVCQTARQFPMQQHASHDLYQFVLLFVGLFLPDTTGLKETPLIV
jgi:hypothetical protein